MVTRRTAIAGIMHLTVLGLSSFVLGYGLLKASGLFSAAPVSVVRALHGAPSQIALYALMAVLLLWTILGDASGRRGARLMLRSGLFLMACGLVVSSYVRFEGKILLTTGQQFTGNAQEYIEGSLYTGKKAPVPQFTLDANEVTAWPSENGLILEKIFLKALYGKESRPPREVSIGSGLPWTDGGLFFRVTRFGYSPLFRFTDEAGNVLQEFFWALDIFPPGAEDSFRSLWIPHVFYVKYYPDGMGEGEAHGGPSGPLVKLRIVRNIDLLFNGNVRLNEPVRFEIMSVSFPEVRTWAEVSVVRDNGMLLFFAGSLIAGSAIVIRHLRARSRKDGAQCRPEGQAS